MKKVLLLAPILLMLTACAHHRDVRPGANGIHRVVLQTDDTEKGARDAISQANHYCEKKEKEAVFLQEASAYTGDMDEKTYQSGKRAAKVANTIGYSGYGHSDSGKGMGSFARMLGGATNAALGDAYKVDMSFKCQ